MKIKNEYVKIKQGKNEVELHNLILDKYLSLFASSVLEKKYKGLDSCLINCTIQEEITPSMDAMHWDFYLNEQNLYNNSDYKGASKIITKYLYEPNFKEQIQSFIGQKILSIGFAQMVEEPTLPDGSDATFELYAILDVSNYNLYVQDMQEFVVERVDTVTTDMVFSSDTEKFPIHLSPRGNSYFVQQEEAGTREVGILNAIGKGYNSMFPTALMPKSNFNITRNENEIDITGLSIQENTGEELYPSNELYPKKKWSEEIQKGEKGSEVIIEGNDKEAFVDIEGKSEQETSTQGNNLFDEQYYNNSAIYSVNVYKYTLTKIKGNRGLYVKAQLKEGKTAQSGIYACLCSTVQPNIPESTFRWFIFNGVPGTNGAVFNTTDLYFSFYPSDTPLNKIFDNYNLWVSTDDINYEPFTPESPSPDYPSEIHSVADDVNLFDKEANVLTTANCTYTYENGIYTITNTNNSNPLVVLENILPKGKYILNSDNYLSAATQIRDSNENLLANLGSNYQNRTFKINSDASKIYFNWGTTSEPIILNLNKLKIQKGTEATSYSPYNQGTVTIKQRGKNLLNVTATSRTYNNTLIVTVNNDKSITFNGMNSSNEPLYFRLAPNFDLQAGTYTLSNKNSNVGENSAIFYDDGGNFEPRSNIVTKTFSNIVTVKPYIKISIGATFDNFTIYPMIEKNLTATDYELYQANDYTIQTEPLRSLPNGVKDTIEVDGIHRRVGRIVLNGSENWGTVGNDRYYITISNKRSVTEYIKAALSSNYFQSMEYTGGNANIGYMSENYYTTGNKNIFFNYNGSNNDLAGFKTWLSTHNTEVLYELAQEVIEPFTEEQMEVLGSIQTFEGYNNFTTTDDLQPIIQVTEYENCVYPQKAQMNWIFYQYGIYKFIDTATGYEYTGRLYREAKNTNKSGNLSLKIKYERGE